MCFDWWIVHYDLTDLFIFTFLKNVPTGKVGSSSHLGQSKQPKINSITGKFKHQSLDWLMVITLDHEIGMNELKFN